MRISHAETEQNLTYKKNLLHQTTCKFLENRNLRNQEVVKIFETSLESSSSNTNSVGRENLGVEVVDNGLGMGVDRGSSVNYEERSIRLDVAQVCFLKKIYGIILLLIFIFFQIVCTVYVYSIIKKGSGRKIG